MWLEEGEIELEEEEEEEEEEDAGWQDHRPKSDWRRGLQEKNDIKYVWRWRRNKRKRNNFSLVILVRQKKTLFSSFLEYSQFGTCFFSHYFFT